jgi:hypothetical protein
MHEEVNEKSIAFTVKAGKMTAQVLMKAMQKFLQRQKSGKTKSTAVKPGQISMKELTAQTGGNVSNIEISKENIGSFDPIARKYGLTYTLKKAGKDRYYVFFNGKSVDAMTAAFKEYTAKITRKTTRRPSLVSALRKLVEQVRTMAAAKTKHKSKEQEL